MDLQRLARALAGEVNSGQVLAPGPGHSPKGRSLSVKLSADATDGFVVNSSAGDDPMTCKDYVRSKAGIEPFKPNGKRKPTFEGRLLDSDRIHVETNGPPSKQRKYLRPGPRPSDPEKQPSEPEKASTASKPAEPSRLAGV
jgi:hypothetical protein